MWIVYPKEELKKLVKKNDNLTLLLDSLIIDGGDDFGLYYTGKGFVNCTLEFKREMDEAREEWTKLFYLLGYFDEFETSFFQELKSIIRPFVPGTKKETIFRVNREFYRDLSKFRRENH